MFGRFCVWSAVILVSSSAASPDPTPRVACARSPSSRGSPTRPRAPWRTLGLVLGTALAVWLVDFLTKEWVIATMAEGERRLVLGELLQWHFVRNPGAAFSLAAGSTWIFTILAAAVVVFIILQLRRIRSIPFSSCSSATAP